MTLKPTLFAVCLIGASALVGAQEPPVSAPPLVVSGSRVAGTELTSVAPLTVIDAAQIAARRNFSLVEMLRQVPGVHVIEQGGRGGFATVLMRGGEPNFTAVYINGVQVNDSTNSRGGSFDFSTLNADDIERIEVIRGSQSAIYGSGSLAGVINVVTRAGADELGVSASASAGSDGFWRAAGALSVPLGRHGLRLAVFSEEDGDPVPGSRHRLSGGRLAGNVQLAEHTTLFADVKRRDADAKAFPEDSGGSLFAVIREVETREADETQVSLSLLHTRPGGTEFNVYASVYERDELSDSPGIAPGVFAPVPPIVADTTFKREVLTAVARFSGAALWSAAVGAELRREDGDATGTIDFGFPIPTDFGIDRDITSAFAEASFAPHPDVTLNAGLRYDDAGAEGSESTPRIGLRYRAGDSGVSLHATLSEGFKLASFFALAQPLIANPDLLPERARSASVGLEFAPAAGRYAFGVDVFRNSFRDLVDFDPVLFTNVNRSKVVTKGVEMSFEYAPGDGRWTASSYASYLEADILGSDSRLRGRPHLRVGTAFDWRPLAALGLRADLWYTDSVFESSVATGLVAIGSFVRADLAATYSPSRDWSVFGAVQNLFDRDYTQAVGFPSPGRRFRVGVEYRL